MNEIIMIILGLTLLTMILISQIKHEQEKAELMN